MLCFSANFRTIVAPFTLEFPWAVSSQPLRSSPNVFMSGLDGVLPWESSKAVYEYTLACCLYAFGF
jgi:hypothetical protein